jgi:hypothetical protein
VNNQFFFDSTTGNLGLGASTTPWATLSINPNGITGPAFAIGSSTATSFVVTNGGLVGIGTTSPAALLHLAGAGGSISVQDMSAPAFRDNMARFRGLVRLYWRGGGVAFSA